MNKAVSTEVLPPIKLANNANLKNGNDAATAKQLTKLFSEAQNGMRRIVALGLFAWEVKETQLKHGEWGTWLAQHCPKLAEIHSQTSKPQASRALRGFMDLTKSVLENCGCPSIEKYLETTGKLANNANLGHGKFLLIADKKVPEDIKPFREKIFALVDGKTQQALFLEFKQADEDSDKPKRGRLKGSSGLTKEQREKAAQREEQQRLNELEETILENITWLLEIADAKNLGMMDGKLIKKFCDAADTASGFGKKVLVARASEKEGAK